MLLQPSMQAALFAAVVSIALCWGNFSNPLIRDAQKENPAEAGLSKSGRGAGIRTPEWRDQNPLPYRLATPLQ